MVHMTIDMPEEALASLRTDSEDFARQLRVAAAVKWYELRRVIRNGRPRSPVSPARSSSPFSVSSASRRSSVLRRRPGGGQS